MRARKKIHSVGAKFYWGLKLAVAAISEFETFIGAILEGIIDPDTFPFMAMS